MPFSALPPEINSGRLYSGPGSGPLIAAAMAWGGMAAELRSAAASYSSAISTLTGQAWQGPASMSMSAAAAPYIEWLTTTATQAEQTAAQATAAANAYNQAFAMTVPPTVVTGNRSQLMALVASNFLGQNTPAIATNEAHYGEMWAQDATAMANYSSSSSSASSSLLPFATPAQNSEPDEGLVDGETAGSFLSLTATRTALSALNNFILGEIGILIPLGSMGGFITAATGLSHTLASEENAGPGAPPPPRGDTLVGTPAGGGPARPPVGPAPGTGGPGSAMAGRAYTVGALSVPQGWATPPEIRQLAKALPQTSTAAVPATTASTEENPYPQLGMAGMAGGGMGGLAGLGAAGANTASAPPPAAANLAAQNTGRPAVTAAAKPAAGPVTLPTENTAEHLANTLAAIPGATVVVIPPSTPPPQ